MIQSIRSHHSRGDGVLVRLATVVLLIAALVGLSSSLALAAVTPPPSSSLSGNATANVGSPTINVISPSFGPTIGNRSVTIGGADLSGATSVTFGGVSVVSIDSNDPTSIVVTVPGHIAGQVDVVVTTGIAPPDTEPDGYVYIDAPTISLPAQSSYVTNTSVDFSGTASPGSSVAVRESITLCIATADGGGAWGCTATLAQGGYIVSVTSAIGGAVTSSPTRSFTVDSVAPVPPVVTSPADGGATNDTTPTFTGTAEPGSTVTVKEGSNTLCIATAAGGAGNWSCESVTPLTPGNHNVSVKATDAAGNPSTGSTLALEIDTTSPPAPAIGSANVTGDTTPTIFGTAEPGSTIAVTVDGAPYCTTTTTGAGNWSCESGTPLALGNRTVSVKATDPAGNPSSPATLALTIDTTQPDAPAFSSPATTSDTTPTFAGTAEPNGTVKVSVDGTLYCTATANGTGNWNNCTSVTPLSAGSHTVTATATDAAANTSPPATQALTIDTGAPAAPAISSPAATNDTTPTLAGTAEPGATVTVKVDGVTVCTDTASASGAWSCTAATPLSEGSHSITVTATDPAGNTSVGAEVTIGVDVTAPSKPLITSPSATIDRTPLLSGTAEPGCTVTVVVDPDNNPATNDSVTYATVTNASGNWNIDTGTATPLSGTFPTNGITLGATVGLQAVARDLAGNASSAASKTLYIGGRMFLPLVHA